MAFKRSGVQLPSPPLCFRVETTQGTVPITVVSSDSLVSGFGFVLGRKKESHALVERGLAFYMGLGLGHFMSFNLRSGLRWSPCSAPVAMAVSWLPTKSHSRYSQHSTPLVFRVLNKVSRSSSLATLQSTRCGQGCLPNEKVAAIAAWHACTVKCGCGRSALTTT